MSESGRKPLPQFKVVLLGNEGVGKTSILKRICDGVFKESRGGIHDGIDYRSKYIDADEKVRVSVFANFM